MEPRVPHYCLSQKKLSLFSCALAASLALGCGGDPGDGGTPDMAGPDLAGPPIAVACSDTSERVYETPDPLPPMDEARRGEILRCATESEQPGGEVAAILAAAGAADIKVSSGARLYQIAYLTERNYAGSLRVGTARLYLPMTRAEGPLPIVVVSHGTVGLADVCAPSRRNPSATSGVNVMALSFAGIGYPVVVPDYAGLGNDGIQGYGDGVDTAYSALDAARAARRAIAPQYLSDKVLFVGHSQGGNATLNVQALARGYGAGGVVPAVVVLSAEYKGGQGDMPRPFPAPSTPVRGSAAISVLANYATYANTLGADRATEPLQPAIRSDFKLRIEGLCAPQFGAWLDTQNFTVATLWDETFVMKWNSCVGGGACEEPAKTVLAPRVRQQPADKMGPRVLVVSGAKDTQNTPAQIACTVDALRAAGVDTSACIDKIAEHDNIVPRQIAFARSWLLAASRGETPPSCPATAMEPLPACK